SFHHTTSDGNQPDSDQIRAVSWSFKGAQLTVYGAPKSLLLHPSGHAEICVEMKCQAIDMTRIYNNIWSTNDRVLLYSNDRFDPTKTTFATIHFLEKESPISGVVKGFALSHIVVTEVRPRNMVESGTRLIKHTIKDDYPDVEYLPWRFWDVETYPTIFGMSRTFHRTSTWINEVSSRLNRRVEFTIPSRTASCQIYGAPRPRLIHPHGKQETCIYQRFRPDECHPIDVEQAYLTVDPDVINEPVLIHSFDGLDVRYTSKIQLKLADRTETGDRNVRGMTFSDLVCWEYQDGRGPYWEWNPGHGSPGEMTSTVESVPRYTPTNPGPTVPQGTPTSTKTAGRPLPTSTHPHEDPPSPGPPDLSLWFAVLYLLGLALWIRYRRLTITQNCPPEQQPILPTSSSSRSSRSGPQSSSPPSYTNSTATAQPAPGHHPEQVARPLGMEQVLGLSFSMINDLPLEVLAVTVESVTGAVYTVPPAEPGYWARSRRYILKLKLMKCLWDWRFAYEVGRRIDEQERERIAQLHRDRMADEQRRVQERQERERMQPSGECVICYDARATVLILDCGHLCLCSGCATRVQQQGSRCPMCRGQVRRIVSTYSP
ncbi:E3 ubiquitin-protein ligase neurl1b, partial [Tulasnella sp. 418]